jgi:small subunit ribosomal protein S2
MNEELSLMNLYSVGAHRGNHKSRINPKLKKLVHSIDKNLLCIIDLNQTLASLESVKKLSFKLGQKRRQIFIVGTSKYLLDYATELAKKFNLDSEPMPYANERWIGGTLTNLSTVKKTVNTIKKLSNMINNVDFFNGLTRNEQLLYSREYNKKLRLYGGLQNLKNNRPGAVIVLDLQKNYNTVLEAQACGVPVIAFTNLNPTKVPDNTNYTLVFNNLSLNAVKLISEQITSAYNAGLMAGAPVQVNAENGDKVKKFENQTVKN